MKILLKMVASERESSSGSLMELSLCRSIGYPSCLLNEDGERNLERIVKLMKQDYKKTRAVLKHWVLTEGPLPPLQLICRLNEEVPIHSAFLLNNKYIFQQCSHQNPHSTEVTEFMVGLPTKKRYCHTLNMDMPSSILRMPHRLDHLYEAFEAVYSNSSISCSRRTSAAAEWSCVLTQIVNTLMTRDEKMQTFFKAVSNKIVESAVKLIAEDGMQGCYLTDLLNNNYIFQQCLPNFLLHNLKHLLSYPTPQMEPNTVIALHSKKWSSHTLNVGKAFSIAKMLSLLSPEVIISELKAAADLLPFRWKHLLTVMSVLVTEKNESSPLLKGLIDDWLRTGLEENDKNFLYLALIAARHCCAEKTTLFPNYITWFGSAQPSNPTQFITFFKFLTELVPHEPPLYLKIHVNKVPAAPSGCQTVLNDYIALAKTRLSDLNETTDYLSIFNKCHDTEEENQASDVTQLINHFIATNEIAKPVIEASVFRKQYYEKVFLKYLLSSSSEKDPVRAQVIRKLNSMGKIPPSMFDLWQSK